MIQGLVIGSAGYIQCVNRVPSDCATRGPGSDLSFKYEFFVELGALLSQTATRGTSLCLFAGGGAPN